MSDETHETSNPAPAHREPPPSLGMIAHIWGGHLGSVDVDAPAEPADSAADPVVVIDPAPPRVTVD
jgi:hypothetical protein